MSTAIAAFIVFAFVMAAMAICRISPIIMKRTEMGISAGMPNDRKTR